MRNVQRFSIICRLILIIGVLGIVSHTLADEQKQATESSTDRSALKMFIFGVNAGECQRLSFPFSPIKLPYVAKFFTGTDAESNTRVELDVCASDACRDGASYTCRCPAATACQAKTTCAETACPRCCAATSDTATNATTTSCTATLCTESTCPATLTVSGTCPATGASTCRCPALCGMSICACKCGENCECAAAANAHVGALHQQLVKVATENAQLKARHEAAREIAQLKDRFVHELVEAKIEAARVRSRLEFAEEREELIDDFVDTLVENAILEVRLDSLDERQELINEIAHLHAERHHAKRAVPVPGPAVQPAILQALKEARSESAALKQRISHLEKQLQEFVRTARRSAEQHRQ